MKKLVIEDLPAPLAPSVAAPETYIVGLQRAPPRKDRVAGEPPRYYVVTGTISNPIVDKTPDPLEFALEAMKNAVKKMSLVIP